MHNKLARRKNRQRLKFGTHYALAFAAWLALPFASSNAPAQNAAPKVDLHRAEIEYRAMRERNEKGTIPPNALLNAVQQAAQMAFDPTAWPGVAQTPAFIAKTPVAGIDTNLWTWIGPGNIGGRIRAIVIHPTLTNTMWTGGVDGGVW